MRKPIIAVLLLLMIPVLLPAAPQHFKVSGTVTDAATGEPLIGAVVNVDELWAITDADGKFVIDKVQPGKYDIKVSILGYVDYKLSIEV
ncbi:MAG TPA: hypothetical protein DHU72_01405, partial [Rikenellaceae bacterium]|nr:hypothetical protein [Rikenellaceae bacterium]